MSSASLVRALRAVLLLCVLSNSTLAVAGGPVFLAGHDADDHGFTAVYADLFDSLYSNVTNGGSGILAVGADPSTTSGNWIVSVANQMTVPQSVTFVNNAAITTQSFTGFAIIFVPSTTLDVTGGINLTTELPLLNARSVQVAEFIAAGGGVFGLTQSQDVPNPYAYLGPFAVMQTVGLPSSGDCDGNTGNAVYDNVGVTPIGQTLGISDTNIDGCCWHNAFTTYPDFVSILAYADEPLCTVPQPINGLPVVVGCFECQIPGQLNLAPALEFNLINTVHTFTATFVESVVPNAPIDGADVTFTIISGPNMGENGNDVTDVNGDATFAYTGDSGIGVDRVQATAEDPSTSEIRSSNIAIKFWDTDCNNNAVPDSCDVDCTNFNSDCLLYAGCGASADTNQTGVPDECEGCAIVGPCDDGNLCTENDTCDGFNCAGTPIDCGSESSTCAVGSCNGLTGLCEGLPTNEGGACNDGNLCTTGDVCTAGACGGEPVDCSFLESQCTEGQCDGGNGGCVSVNINEGGPCDDGNSCNSNDICLAGVCSACGNNSTDVGCGETCDPPLPGICDPTCRAVVCGNSIIQSGEECDDGNATSGDGCSSLCLFEDKLCIEGTQPSVARSAKRVAFVSDFDYVPPGNADGNKEIFVFDRKRLDKAIKKRVKKEGIDPKTAKDQLIAASPQDYFYQVTNTVAPVVNELPSINGTGRVTAFVSNGDIKPGGPGNTDGNREIYRIDVKRKRKGDADATVQVTNSPAGTSNLNPNLRAYSNLLTFDSDANLVPNLCVGGDDDMATCNGPAGCTSGACGNPEGNREVFVHVQNVYVGGEGLPMRQLTASTFGESTVGQSVNFNGSATAFSTTANLLGDNPEGNSEIFQIGKTPDTLASITSTVGGEQAEAAQAVRYKIALTSNGDLTGLNADGNRELFFYEEGGSPPYRQIGESAGCLNAVPAIDSRGRYMAFQSSCNRISTLGNPDQSVFMWDDKKKKLLPLVVRGELSATSGSPQVTSRLGVLTYESNLDSIIDPAICFLNVRVFLKTLEAQP